MALALLFPCVQMGGCGVSLTEYSRRHNLSGLLRFWVEFAVATLQLRRGWGWNAMAVVKGWVLSLWLGPVIAGLPVS